MVTKYGNKLIYTLGMLKSHRMNGMFSQQPLHVGHLLVSPSVASAVLFTKIYRLSKLSKNSFLSKKKNVVFNILVDASVLVR